MLSKLGNRGNAHWCNFPLEYLPSAPRLMHKHISFSAVLLSRSKTIVRRGSGACMGNGNRSNVSSPVSVGGTQGRSQVLLSLFLSTPGGGNRFFLLAVIFHYGWKKERKRDVRLLSVWTHSGELGREIRRGQKGIVTRTAELPFSGLSLSILLP